MDDDNMRNNNTGGVVLIEVAPGDAALVFTENGLQAYLPENMAPDSDLSDLPWHLKAVQEAMIEINKRSVCEGWQEGPLEPEGCACSVCLSLEPDTRLEYDEEALLAFVAAATPGEA